jgi:DNA modification methylase
MKANTILVGDALEQLRTLPDESVHCCVTSPPYWSLRDYGQPGQLGLEPTPDEYVSGMVRVFREVRRVLRDDGVIFVNLGDSYAGGGGYAPNAPCNQRRANGESWGKLNPHSRREGEARAKARPGYTPPGLKPKDLVGIPWRVAFALQADGWYLRSDIIWAKPNPMPESVTDRPTKAHEYLFLLSKSKSYFYDADAVREAPSSSTIERWGGRAFERVSEPGTAPDRNDSGGTGERSCGTNPAGRNRRSVWTIATQPYTGAHFAVMPSALVAPCVLAGSPAGGLVLDPFMGAGTVGLVARENGRDYIGIELNPEYAVMAEHRIANRGRRVEDVEALPGQEVLFP